MCTILFKITNLDVLRVPRVHLAHLSYHNKNWPFVQAVNSLCHFVSKSMSLQLKLYLDPWKTINLSKIRPKPPFRFYKRFPFNSKVNDWAPSLPSLVGVFLFVSLHVPFLGEIIMSFWQLLMAWKFCFLSHM